MQNNSDDRLRGMLGFAMRAGRVLVGSETVISCLGKPGRVKLVLYTADASDGAKRRIISKCEFYGIKTLLTQIDMGELGRLLGKTYGPVCVGITDEGFAREIEKCVSPEVTHERNPSSGA